MKWLKRNNIWLAALVMVAGCSRTPKQAPPMPTPEVAVLTVAPQSLVLTTELPGRTAPFRIAEIRPQVTGLIEKRLFTEGEDVQVGQALYQIDPPAFQAALDSAEASLVRAEANLPSARARAERVQGALASRAVSQQDVDDSTAVLKQAEADILFWKAAVKIARINLVHAHITAPIAGRIGRSSVTDGAIVTAYQPMPLATIQQLDPIYVDVPQSTSDLLRLQRRQLTQDGNGTVKLLLEDGSEYPLEGTLQFRDITVDPATATVTLRMVFPNPKGVLLPGMFVRAVVKEGVNDQAILVPQNAVTRDPKGTPLVMIVNAKGEAEQRILKTDRAVGNQWLVTDGLAAGDQVIVEGLQKTRPGKPVKVATK